MTTAAKSFVSCPSCNDQEVPFGSAFCDSCGAAMPKPGLKTSKSCRTCNGEDFDADGFCKDCGTRARPVRAQEPAVVAGPGLAGLTDVGRRHKRNDDAFSIAGPAAGGPGTAIVVCDGVSNSQSPDIASPAAAETARLLLVAALESGADPRKATAEAIRAAHAAVCTVPFNRS